MVDHAGFLAESASAVQNTPVHKHTNLYALIEVTFCFVLIAMAAWFVILSCVIKRASIAAQCGMSCHPGTFCQQNACTFGHPWDQHVKSCSHCTTDVSSVVIHQHVTINRFFFLCVQWGIINKNEILKLFTPSCTNNKAMHKEHAGMHTREQTETISPLRSHPLQVESHHISPCTPWQKRASEF